VTSGTSITISAEDRDLIYHRIMLHLSGIDRVWLAARHNDYREADRLGRQVCDELQLVLDDLGWGETRGDEPVELTSPPDVVRRAAGFLRDQAAGEDADESTERGAREGTELENREVRQMCNRLLEAVEPAVASGESHNG
jgi:hypothetical protein